jgi:DEAD/DEAH box helicase domain-containing protein
MPTQSSIVYDLESKKTFAEVGGHHKQAELGVSFLGLYSYSQNKYFSFFEQDLPKLELILQAEKPTIIGFNSISFDNVVVQPYFRSFNISELPQVDILADIYRTLGFRMKLESVAQATLGEGKSGTGLDAIKYYREGNFDALAKYCLDDVRITKDVYDYGCRHGYILYTSGGEYFRMPVQWSTDPTIMQRLVTAFQKHQQITITYLQLTDTARQLHTTLADILDLNDKTVTIYSYSDNSRQIYNLDRILDLAESEQTSAYQERLL